MLRDSPSGRFPFALSTLDDYKGVVSALDVVLGQVERRFFHSPYALMPHVAQLLGLATPLMGSGRSGYSLHAISHQLAPSEELEALWAIPLVERRRIFDELYSFIAPLVLDEQQQFAAAQAEILVSLGHLAAGAASAWEKDLLQRMRTAAPLISRMLQSRPAFAHIAHYGHPADLHREYPFLRDASPRQIAVWDSGSFPTVVEIELQGLARDRRALFGWVIIIGNTTESLLADRSLRERKLRQAARLATRLGARIVGMAGLVASFARGGRLFADFSPDVGFSTGHAYTIYNVVAVMRRAVELVGLDLSKATVAVVGAAGSIGSGCARLFARHEIGRVLLVDQTSVVSGAQLARLVNDLQEQRPAMEVEVTHDLRALRRADILLIATNSSKTFVESGHLAPGAIVVDDSFPKNVSRELLRRRPDVLLLEGGLIQLPYEVYITTAKNMPDLMDAPVTRMISCRETYGCFGETLLLACEEHYTNFGIGPANPDLADRIARIATTYGLRDAPLQCYDAAIDPARIERCRQALAERSLIKDSRKPERRAQPSAPPRKSDT